LVEFCLQEKALIIKVPLDVKAIDFASKQVPRWLEYVKTLVSQKKKGR